MKQLNRPFFTKLILLSAGLFCLEMSAIRLLSSEIRVFAYIKNLALIACFFGMGLGCLPGRLRKWNISATYPLAAFFTALLLAPKAFGYDPYRSVTDFLGRFNEMSIWAIGVSPAETGNTLLALVLLALVLALVTILFLPGGALLARMFEDHPGRLSAYSVNILGSLAGIWLFTGISAIAFPPIFWILLTFILLFPLLTSVRDRLIALVCIGAVAGLAFLPQHGPATIWTPYQKVSVEPVILRTSDGQVIPGGTLLRVNDAFYQRIVDLSPAYLSAHSEIWPEAAGADYMSYNLVYRAKPAPESVLVVGAGTGNDVAAALRNGALHVDAVEIDPVIVALGRENHPEAPYDDPRVTVHIDDARSWFKKTQTRYDLIVFGALDSHTLSSTLSNIQIDNYVYTEEAFREARSILKNDGLVSVAFSAQREFIAFRLRAMLAEAFGKEPLAFINTEIRALTGAGGGLTFFVSKDDFLDRAMAADGQLARALTERRIALQGTTPEATDDWPYLYLEGRKIPPLHLIVMGLMLLLGVLATLWATGGGTCIDPFYFFTGAAFLLVEVQTISRMALLFGTTWLVNSIAISAVLVMILGANALFARIRRVRPLPVYALLAASLAVSALFPDHELLGLHPVLKGLASGLVMGLPIFFAAILFAFLFSRSENPGHALASNLIGALFGGALESLSFLTGIRALGLIAILLYLLSGLALRSSLKLRGHAT